ncbi:MAG: hypothetical protein ISR74_06505 [Candidatus Thioglobus sp.]|nr:hypothetical protein [Candidatus Thioglobus sp.]
MGGIGSGGYYRDSKRATTEGTRRIDIRFLKKSGFLRPNTAGSLSWNNGGAPNGDIRYTMLDDVMILKYRYRHYYSDEWVSVNQDIMLDKTPCNYGGERKWFICPSCGGRCGILYQSSELFKCRSCSDVLYDSQLEGYLDRLLRKSRKLEERLSEGYTGDIYGKPIGMHWRTYNRLKKAENRIQERIDQGFFNRYGYLM